MQPRDDLEARGPPVARCRSVTLAFFVTSKIKIVAAGVCNKKEKKKIEKNRAKKNM